MVNLDQWEVINYTDIKIGDEITRINSHQDGTRAEVRGVVARENFGTFETKGNFALVRRDYPNTVTDLYRRKPTQEELDSAFKFPTTVGAVVEAVWTGNGEVRTFVHTGKVWFWSGTEYPSALKENDFRRLFSSFKLISEGH